MIAATLRDRRRIAFGIATAALVAAVALTSTTPSAADPDDVWDPAAGLVLKGTVLTQNGRHTVHEDGLVYIKGNTIVDVRKPGDSVPQGFDEAPTIDTGGVILPGLINGHSHMAFNALPMWETEDHFENRYQWAGRVAYTRQVKWPKALLGDSKYFDLTPELAKYAEVKALVGGTTSIQGAPAGKRGYAKSLVRNIDFGLDVDDVAQMMPPVISPRFQRDIREGRGVLANMNSGEVNSWFVHLAEGIDEKSRMEFDIIEELGLVRDETVAIHGTALGGPEFRKMGRVGMDLVWSPISNRLYYGKTTDIRTAREMKVNVALAPDWAVGGSKNLLGEMKVADEIDNAEWNDSLSYRDIVDMATRNPAKALGWDGQLGQIRKGYRADILVLDRRGDPYASVVHATDRNVCLVMVDGDPLYGDDEHMSFLKGEDCEVIYNKGGRRKCIDVTTEHEERGDQTFDEIAQKLDDAMKLDRTTMRDTFRDTKDMSMREFDAWFNDKFKGVVAPARTPVFAEEDPAFFNALKNSPNAKFPYDLERYWRDADRPIGAGSSAGAIARGEIGGRLRSTWRATLTEEPRSRRRIARLDHGTPVEILERRDLSAWSKWLKIRAEADGETVEGWIFAPFVEETEVLAPAAERAPTDGITDRLRD